MNYVARLLALLMIGLAAACGPGKPKTPEPVKAANAPTDFTVSALDFMLEFHNDRTAALKKYASKVVVMQGWVWGTKSESGSGEISHVILKGYSLPFRCSFRLDDEAMRTRFLMIELDGMQAMKGRFRRVSKDAEHGDELLEFDEAVPASTKSVADLPVEVEATAAEVATAMAGPDPAARAKYAGRKITVRGTITAIDASGGAILVELSGASGKALKCIVSGSSADALNDLRQSGQEVKATGVLRTSIAAAMLGLSLHDCRIETVK